MKSNLIIQNLVLFCRRHKRDSCLSTWFDLSTLSRYSCDRQAGGGGGARQQQTNK